MRTRLMALTAALLLASASLAIAQAQQKPAEPAATTPSPGSVDFGFRATSTTGDAARYERYRDLRNGVAANLVFGQQSADYLLGVKLENIGYKDGRYQANYANSSLKVTFMFDGIPLNYSYMTSTPWVYVTQGRTANFALDAATRLLVQNKQALGIPTTAAQAKSASVYRGLAQAFDIRALRETATLGAVFSATENVSAAFLFNTYKRTGNMPWGASFAFNNGNELPIPVDNRTTDLSAGLEWAKQGRMFRIAWDGSWFNNNIDTLIWDNPLRATDFSNGLAPPSGPYDPSGYSNGNGPARGRYALAPNNSMNVVSATGLMKLPSHSTLNGSFSVTSMKQNGALIPWTINNVINSPTVWASFPELAGLERSTAEAEVRGYNLALNFASRPNSLFGLTARYRFNDHQNHTPHFNATEYVRFDAVPEETGGETEQFDTRRNTFDVNASFNLVAYTQLRVGYGYDSWGRTGRSFSDMADNTFRVSVDTVGHAFFSLRAIYEFTSRKGSGFSEDALEEGGAQPGLRFYDEADRDRSKGTLLFTVTPIPMVDFTASVAAGRDTYKGEGHEFGLLNADVTSYNFGVNVTPKPQVAFGMNYGYDKFESLQRSRNANPPPDPQFNDPLRNWDLNNDETVNNFNLYLDLIQAIKKTDIRFGYDFSDSDNAFIHSGPRVASLSAIGQFIPLPNVTNSWQRLTADLRYHFSPKVALGAAYWYEKFSVTDFATIDIPGPNGFYPATGQPRVDYLGGLVTGYGNRPYTGNTFFLRVMYFF